MRIRFWSSLGHAVIEGDKKNITFYVGVSIVVRNNHSTGPGSRAERAACLVLNGGLETQQVSQP